MAWNSRFKQVSAAKRKAKEGEAAEAAVPPPRSFPQHVIDHARSVSPEHFLRRHYPDLSSNRGGTALWVPKVLRCNARPDGTWCFSDWENNSGGDNVALLQFVSSGMTFPEAILELTGESVDFVPLPRASLSVVEQPVLYPCLPPVGFGDRGRAYLCDRGISGDGVGMAEQAGFLRYADSGVVFLGRDLASPARSVRSATIRYFEPVNWKGGFLTKRDFANSDKRFPGFLPGDSGRILVLESGISGLAARDIVVREGHSPPTVIVTGGVNTRRWVGENEPLREVLVRAGVVEIWGENETTVEKQERTDALRRKLQVAIAEQRSGELPVIVYPPDGLKDAADWNCSNNLALNLFRQ